MSSKRLEVVTNLALLAAAISIIAFNARPLFSRTQDPAAPYKVGDRIKPTSELRFDQPTFILSTVSTCRYCTASMPFYRQLLETGARVIAVTQEPIEKNREYLTSHKVQPAVVLSASANGLRFRSTPTLLLVDGGGVVQRVWVGQQKSDGQEEILRSTKQ